MPPLLEVVHLPNPCDQHHSEHFLRDPFPFMWYYRTEVRNNTDRPLRIVWFEGYFYVRGRWVPSNVKGRELKGEDFRQWYGGPDGQKADDPIPARSSAVCVVNWHGRRHPWAGRSKWCFRAMDDSGNTYEAEAEVVSRLIRNGKALRWLLLQLLIWGVAITLVWLMARHRT